MPSSLQTILSMHVDGMNFKGHHHHPEPCNRKIFGHVKQIHMPYTERCATKCTVYPLNAFTKTSNYLKSNF